jgi:hypothetical protein
MTFEPLPEEIQRTFKEARKQRRRFLMKYKYGPMIAALLVIISMVFAYTDNSTCLKLPYVKTTSN